MDDFAKLVAQSCVASVRHLIYLYIFGFIITYFLLRFFGLNIWTFILAHVVIVVLWWIKPIKWPDR